METLTLEDILLSTKRAIAEMGSDYVYVRVPAEDDHFTDMVCRYFYEGQPSCIVGHVVAILDLPHPPEGEAPNRMNDRLFAAGTNVRIETDGVAFLTYIQKHQDFGIPWGQSYDLALEDVERERGWGTE